LIADEPHGAAPGTEVSVSRLFENFPVRMEFLKSERTESFHILNVAQNLALAHPSVRFSASADGQRSFSTPGSGSLEDCLLALFGPKLVDGMLQIEPGKWLGIEGLVSRPGRDWANRRHISFFVNGRWVNNPTLSAALAEAYRGLLPAGRHPAAYLHLELPPEDVDVNVHPAKAEVRFRVSGRLFTRLSGAIRRTLVERSDFVPIEVGDTRPVVDSFFIPAAIPYDSDRYLNNTAESALPPLTRDATDAAPNGGQISSPHMRALGQIDRTYVVAAGPDGLYLIDQHTAHERVLYEDLLDTSISPDRQQLLAGQTVDMGAVASAWLEENRDLLSDFGIDVEYLGGTTWIVNGVPSMAVGRQAGGFLEEVVRDLSTIDGRRSDPTERARWAVACRSAVKAGDALSVPEMQALVERLLECDLGRTCPHGRPTTLKLSRELLDRQFGRA
jgi:DNA mismatch repair protein MutL